MGRQGLGGQINSSLLFQEVYVGQLLDLGLCNYFLCSIMVKRLHSGAKVPASNGE